MNAKQIARLMALTSDVSTVHVPNQHVVKSGYVWTYNGFKCWGINNGQLVHDDVYGASEYVDLEYADINELRVYKELKRALG